MKRGYLPGFSAHLHQRTTECVCERRESGLSILCFENITTDRIYSLAWVTYHTPLLLGIEKQNPKHPPRNFPFFFFFFLRYLKKEAAFWNSQRTFSFFSSKKKIFWEVVYFPSPWRRVSAWKTKERQWTFTRDYFPITSSPIFPLVFAHSNLLLFSQCPHGLSCLSFKLLGAL